MIAMATQPMLKQERTAKRARLMRPRAAIARPRQNGKRLVAVDEFEVVATRLEKRLKSAGIGVSALLRAASKARAEMVREEFGVQERA